MISQDLTRLALQSVFGGPGQEGTLQRVSGYPFHFLRRGSASTQQLTQPFRGVSRAQWLLAEPASNHRARHHGSRKSRTAIQSVNHDPFETPTPKAVSGRKALFKLTAFEHSEPTSPSTAKCLMCMASDHRPRAYITKRQCPANSRSVKLNSLSDTTISRLLTCLTVSGFACRRVLFLPRSVATRPFTLGLAPASKAPYIPNRPPAKFSDSTKEAGYVAEETALPSTK
eukprot:6491733-Amphidinium_carterae.1